MNNFVNKEARYFDVARTTIVHLVKLSAARPGSEVEGDVDGYTVVQAERGRRAPEVEQKQTKRKQIKNLG